MAYPFSDLELPLLKEPLRSLKMHPFERVSSTNSTAAGFAGILSQDVVFHSPIFVHPVTGRRFVADLLETVHGIFGRPSYWLRLSEGGATVLLFDGDVEGQTLQVAVVVQDDPEGLIQDLTVLMRPLPVVRRFGGQVMARLGLSEADDTPSPNSSDL
ncbi:MAG TPA: hypothetical protein VK285_00550 [Gaiellaceae bacterium]|nr:hypothetical protein [Gaiellaceae bacterium]